jgi:hypothetical protein
MRRLLLITLALLLTAPLGVTAAARVSGRPVTFLAQVLRASPQRLVLQVAGRRLSLAAEQIGSVPGMTPAFGRRRPATAHLAVGPPSLAPGIQRLEPGITVRVTETVTARGLRAAIDLPRGLSQARRATGRVFDLARDSLTLSTGGGAQLVLHLRVSALRRLGLRSGQSVAVRYHQDAERLVADSVRGTGPRST